MKQTRTKVSRRRFLQTTAAAASTAIAAPMVVPARALGRDGNVAPSERVTLAGLGIGARGNYVLDCFMEEAETQFVAIADVREERRQAVREKTEAKYGKGVKMYRDFREMLQDESIDAVLIATGDRWHTPAALCVARAGKDIYCEKPCSMTVDESIALAETMDRYKVVYQAGTQRRSVPNFMFAKDLCDQGKLGKITEVHANTLHPATSHDWLPAEKQPAREQVDWDLWLGPCPVRPFNAAYVRGGWRGFWDFHGGGILEWGAHTVDLCNWVGSNDEKMPIRYEPTPGGCVATYDNGVKMIMRETGWLGLGTCSARYVGENGWVETGDTGRMEFSSGELRSQQKEFTMAGTSANTHVRNFLDSVRTREPAHSNADVVAKSHIICHAAYIAWQLGRPLDFDPVKIEFNDAEANRMRSRAIRDPWWV